MNRGINDSPISQGINDKLDVLKSVKGFGEFITNCDTPLTIALQGEWGSGKTSYLNLLSTELAEEDINLVYCNTWHFNTFVPKELIPIYTIKKIVSDILNEENNPKEKGAKFGVNSIDFSILGLSVGMSRMESKEGNKDQKKLTKLLGELEGDIEKLRNLSEQKRSIVFIDDLDRVSPEVALEILEVLKIVFDIPNMVFILAIDEETLLNATRYKFSHYLEGEKAEKFLDKIIQVKHSMPIENYDTVHFYREHLPQVFDNSLYAERIEEAIHLSNIRSPRLMKKNINNYLLKKSIFKYQNEDQYSEEQNEFMFMLFLLNIYQDTNIEVYKLLKTSGFENIENERDEDFTFLSGLKSDFKELVPAIQVIAEFETINAQANLIDDDTKPTEYEHYGVRLTAKDMNQRECDWYNDLLKHLSQKHAIVDLDPFLSVPKDTSRMILSNAITFGYTYGNALGIEEIRSNNGKYTIFTTHNENANWKDSQKVVEISDGRGTTYYCDTQLSKSSAYYNARLILATFFGISEDEVMALLPKVRQ